MESKDILLEANNKYPNEYNEWVQLNEQLVLIEQQLEQQPADQELQRKKQVFILSVCLLEILLGISMPEENGSTFSELKKILKDN